MTERLRRRPEQTESANFAAASCVLRGTEHSKGFRRLAGAPDLRRGSMDRIAITGGPRLHGQIAIGGAKNSAIKLMAASLLTDQPLVLTNMPRLADTRFLGQLLRRLGVEVVERDGDSGPETGVPGGRRHQLLRALRPRPPDARLVQRAGPAAGPHRPRQGQPARRLRHRRAAGRPAPEDAGGFGRHHRSA